MVAQHIVDQLARATKTGDRPAWLPRPIGFSMHQGAVTRVDNFNSVVDFAANDPSGLIIPGVRVLQAYNADNPPGVGHVVWGGLIGNQFVILGQHSVPNSIVIP